ncbi:hypothetical protein ACF0H5_019308 [Mactra antiquata]
MRLKPDDIKGYLRRQYALATSKRNWRWVIDIQEDAKLHIEPAWILENLSHRDKGKNRVHVPKVKPVQDYSPTTMCQDVRLKTQSLPKSVQDAVTCAGSPQKSPNPVTQDLESLSSEEEDQLLKSPTPVREDPPRSEQPVVRSKCSVAGRMSRPTQSEQPVSERHIRGEEPVGRKRVRSRSTEDKNTQPAMGSYALLKMKHQRKLPKLDAPLRDDRVRQPHHRESEPVPTGGGEESRKSIPVHHPRLQGICQEDVASHQ